jgi:hypothetical protein
VTLTLLSHATDILGENQWVHSVGDGLDIPSRNLWNELWYRCTTMCEGIRQRCGLCFVRSHRQGLLISSICEEEVQVMEVALGSVFPVLLSSGQLGCRLNMIFVAFINMLNEYLGVLWPLEGMPPVMRLISNFTPLTHTIQAMRCIVSRGETLELVERIHLIFSSLWL